MGQYGHFYSCMCLVIRDAEIFRGLTGGQRTPRDRGVTKNLFLYLFFESYFYSFEIKNYFY